MDAHSYLADQQSSELAETLACLKQTRLGIVPENRAIDTARTAGDPTRTFEAVVCQAAAFAHGGRPYKARRELARLSSDVIADIEMPWRWAVANARGVVAEDFCDYRTAWSEHRSSLAIATELGDPGLLSVSRIQLARLAVESGTMREALTHLGQVSRGGAIPNEVVAAHALLVSIATSRLGTTEPEPSSRSSHSANRAAPSISIDAPEQPTRLLLGISLIAVERGELDWVNQLLDASRSRLRSSSSKHQVGEFVLLTAKVRHLRADRTLPLLRINELLEQCPADLALYSRALFTKASILYDNERFDEALEALKEHDPSKSLQAVACVELERRIHLKLEDWEQAARTFNQLRSLTRPSPVEVETLYRLQAAASEAGALRARNVLLSERNEQIANGLVERDTILNTISNRLQSPLTALSLSAELLAEPSTTAERASRLTTAIQTIARIEEMSRQILLAQELGDVELLLFPQDITLSELETVLASEPMVMSAKRSIHVELTGGAEIAINTDVERLAQLVTSLLWGGLEFSTNRGAISLQITDGPEFGARIQIEIPGLSAYRFPSVSALQPKNQQDKTDPAVELPFRAAYQLANRLGVEVTTSSDPAGNAKLMLRVPSRCNAE